MSAEQLLFGVFAFCTLSAATAVVFVRNAIASAMSLVATFFFLAGIYVLLFAHTIAALQVLVYAGAIMVLFLFVIMLLSMAESTQGKVLTFSASRVLGGVATLALFATLVSVFRKLPAADPAWMQDSAKLATFGTIKYLGEVMYTGWLFPFEAVSLLLLVAILGAVVVAKAKV